MAPFARGENKFRKMKEEAVPANEMCSKNGTQH